MSDTQKILDSHVPSFSKPYETIITFDFGSPRSLQYNTNCLDTQKQITLLLLGSNLPLEAAAAAAVLLFRSS